MGSVKVAITHEAAQAQNCADSGQTPLTKSRLDQIVCSTTLYPVAKAQEQLDCYMVDLSFAS